MSDEPKEPEGQAAESAQPDETEGPKLIEVSEEELKGILAAHERWVKSDGREGEQADLTYANLQKAALVQANLQGARLLFANLQGAFLFGTNLQGAVLPDANLQGASLIGTNLQGAVLHNANLKRAMLSHATLREANLQDADLTDVKGLLAEQLAGANVSGATLPEDIAKFEGLDHVTEISKHARNIFLAVIGGCVFSWLTIATTTDVALLTNATSTPLPIIQTRVPIAGFYWAAPAILLSLYIYLHLYLQRLWEGLASLPAIFPDGRTLDERAYPWLLSGLVRAHVPQLKDKPQARLGLQVIVSIVAAWMLVPGTLGLFWFRYLPRHDWPGTLWLVVLFVVAIAIGIASYRLATSTLRGESWEPIVWRTANKDKRVYNGFAVLTVMMTLIFSLSFNAIEGVPEPSLMSTADLRKAVLPRVDLAGRDLKGANFRFAGLQEADLRTTNLQEADLGWVNLRNADLGRAQLHMTFFNGARLQEANLRGATGLTSAQLDKACGDEKTKLPDYLKDYKIKLCLEELK